MAHQAAAETIASQVVQAVTMLEQTTMQLPPGDGRIRFERASFAYGDGRPVLEEIELEIAPGRTVALIGHTGSGKTTLASLVPAA